MDTDKWHRKSKDISPHLKAKHGRHASPEEEHLPCMDSEDALSKLDGDMHIKTLISHDFEKVLRKVIREEVPGLLKTRIAESSQENITFHPLLSITTKETAEQAKDTKAECLTDETKIFSTVHAHERPDEVFVEPSAPPHLKTPGQTMSDGCAIKPLNVSSRQSGIYKKTSDHEDTTLQDIHINNRTAYQSPHLRPKTRFSMEDERECLSQALRSNVGLLVDRLQFNLCDLPEQLISAGHMTEDECRMVREDMNRKDQVRYLVSRAKGRDLSDLHKFLKIISTEAPDIVIKIYDQFAENKRNGVKCKTCALCQCIEIIDIKDIVDGLWSVGAIPDGLYNDVVACKKPRGRQDDLWELLFDTCNNTYPQSERNAIYGELFKALLKRGNFEFIVTPLRNMLDRDAKLECTCHCNFRNDQLDNPLYASCSSYTPRSSLSEGLLSEQSTSIISDQSVRTMCLETKQASQEVNHTVAETTRSPNMVAATCTVKKGRGRRHKLYRVLKLGKLRRQRDEIEEEIELQEI